MQNNTGLYQGNKKERQYSMDAGSSDNDEDYEDENDYEDDDQSQSMVTEENGSFSSLPITPMQTNPVPSYYVSQTSRRHLLSEAETTEGDDDGYHDVDCDQDAIDLHNGYVPYSDDDKNPEMIPVNRYGGVIYASRFFVTRVGFLRSVKRMLVLSTTHLFVVDPYSDEIKEKYAYDEIKEITVSSDTSSTDRSFTIFIGKNTKETYSCRDRNLFLSSYYQLRERASSFKRDIIDAANPSGVYFDSLFELCGKEFTMVKLSKTRGTLRTPVKVPIKVAVRATSIDRLHPESKQTVSSILLIDIVKIQKIRDNPQSLVLYLQNNNVHQYWCEQREPFIQTVANNLRSWLSISLYVEEVADAGEYDALISPRDSPQSVLFEIPVYKISKNLQHSLNPLQFRLLALTASGIVERDPQTRRTIASYTLSDLYNVIIYPHQKSNFDANTKISDFEHRKFHEITNENKNGYFSFELKNGRTRRYICESSSVSCRSDTVGVGLKQTTEQDVNLLRDIIQDHEFHYADVNNLPTAFPQPNSTTLLTPFMARNLFVSNLMEMCRMNKIHVNWSTEETKIACKVGMWHTDIHPEWEDILIRRLGNLSLIPNLVTQDALDSILFQLEQFNKNVTMGNLKQRDRRALAALLKLIENLKEYSVAQIKDPSNSDAPIPSVDLQVAILLAIQRILCTRSGFEEIPNSQFRNAIGIIFELTHSPSMEVSYAASNVIKCMTLNYSDGKSIKSESANRRVVFTRRNCQLFVSRSLNPLAQNPTSNNYANICNNWNEYSQSEAMANEQSAGLKDRKVAEGKVLQKAIATALVGMDYLVLSSVLQTLEVCLSSGKKSTPERVCNDLLQSMQIGNFTNHQTLFTYNRSLSFGIMKCSSILVKVHVLEQPSELVELIQDFARQHGILIWQLYLALNSFDKTQRRISSQLVALLTHENARSSNVIRNIFPHGLLNDLSYKQYQYDEYGRYIPVVPSVLDNVNAINSNSTGGNTASNSPAKQLIVSVMANQRYESSITSRYRIVKGAKCVVLLPDFFDRLWKTYRTKDLMWSADAVKELLVRLELELSTMDINRLKHLYYLLSDPLSQSDWSGLEQKKTAFELESFQAVDTNTFQMPKANDAMSTSTFAYFCPIHYTVPDTYLPVDDMTSSEIENEETTIHHDDTLEELKADKVKKSIVNKMMDKQVHAVPHWFVAWHSDEFRLDYMCFQNEIKVGAYYLMNILNDQGILKEDIEDADQFMMLLYYRILAEDRKVSDSATAVTEDIRLICLKVMIQLYNNHCSMIRSLPFLNHFLRESMGSIFLQSGGTKDIAHASSISSDCTTRWPLLLRGNVMIFMDRILNSAINVARFLYEPYNVQVVLNLLAEVKPFVTEHDVDTDFDFHFNTSTLPSKLADSKTNADESKDGSKTKPKVTLFASNSVADNETNTGKSLLHSNERVQVVNSYYATLSGAGIMQTCLNILIKLVHCQTAENDSELSQQSNSILSNHPFDVRNSSNSNYYAKQNTRAVSSIGHIKSLLCERTTLKFLVGLLDCPNRSVFKKCLHLLQKLIINNISIVPSLYRTGLFYFLFRYVRDVNEMTLAANVLSSIHLRQLRTTSVTAIKSSSGEQCSGLDESSSTVDNLTEICMRSWLVKLLPVSMIAQLLRHGSERFAEAFFSNSNNPEVLWNSEMRALLVMQVDQYILNHIDAKSGVFFEAESTNVKDSSSNSSSKQCLIEYPPEVYALQCYQYYLHNLLDEKSFPNWPIHDESAFLKALMETILQYVEDLDQTESVKNSSTKTSRIVKDMSLIFDTVCLLLRRFPNSNCLRNYTYLTCILTALEKVLSIFPTLSNSADANASSGSSSAEIELFYKAFVSAIRVVNLAVNLSDDNAILCSSASGLRALSGALHLTHTYQELSSSSNAPNDIIIVTHWVLESLVCVLQQPNGRVSIAAQSLDLLPCLTKFLHSSFDHRATILTLQIVCAMAESSGEMAEVLLQQLAEHGMIWYLSLLIFQYHDPNTSASEPFHTSDNSANAVGNSNDTSSSIQNTIGLEAGKGIEMLLKANAREESIAKYVHQMQDTIVALFTRPLIDVLLSKGVLTFLKYVNADIREPHIMWTNTMRTELIGLAQQAIKFHMNTNYYEKRTTATATTGVGKNLYILPAHFMYTAQKEELCIAGIYVNFYNTNPERGIMDIIEPIEVLKNESISKYVLCGLLSALAHDISGVKSQPAVLKAILTPRMLPIATAIRHMLQYINNMDVELIQVDGIAILFSVFDLDHSVYENVIDISCLQLRIMECIHITVFSGKCIDMIAAIVPNYVNSIFDLVYHNLPKKESTMEGKVARSALQVLGNLCLIPACIDSLVKGMNAEALTRLLPEIWTGNPQDMQLLLCMHFTPLKRHTNAATQFAKSAVSSQLVQGLLVLLSKYIGDNSQTKMYVVRFLSVLSTNPGSGSTVSQLLHTSKAWEVSGDTAQGTSDDVRRLLIVPVAPALFQNEHANPLKIV